MTNVAIIGAGLAGLTAAKGLSKTAEVHIFEKSWRAGGRMSARTGAYAFDHGAQYFTARSSTFKTFLAPFVESGIITRWDARFVELDYSTVVGRRYWDAGYPHYTAVPGMNGLCLAMAEELDVHYQSRVSDIRPDGSRWELFDPNNRSLGSFDWVVAAIPAEQAAVIMPRQFVYLDEVRQKHMLPCNTLMLGYSQAPAIDFDTALVKNADISWITVNNSKPGRPEGCCLLVHSSNAWAEENLGLSDESIMERMISELTNVLEQDMSDAVHIDLHRWRYANIEKQSGAHALVDIDNRLATIGDWCIKGRVESAFTSGNMLAMTCSF